MSSEPPAPKSVARPARRPSRRAMIELTLFCCAVLTYLVATGRPEWFDLSSATATPVASFLAQAPHGN
ncbi:hypothetical protein [Novosphingobium nitrogenifigens]|uniref:hypothetical protein n=1 Tax=Novosphingobium nitrogenifigens TaxID=378548 RepID=UPI000B32E8E4|nr:hypothetical protein [Novosphingobium nitrogenifigens]